MKASRTVIAWNAATELSYPDVGRERPVPLGSVAIGPLLDEDEGDWPSLYSCSGGASIVARQTMAGLLAQHHVMLDYYALVYVYGLHPYVVHRAFLLIDEYQHVIKQMGYGPAKGEPGHDPRVGYGRAVVLPVPALKIWTSDRATHFWPVADTVPRGAARIHARSKAVTVD